MEYSNPEIKENVNVSKRHPLKEFFLLCGGVIGIVLIATISLSLLAERLAIYIPFSVEEALTQDFIDDELTNEAIEDYLQSLADRLSINMELPEDMHIQVHYSEENVVNAFATLGGHVFFYEGLVEKLPSENALAMVMAHEIAHVKHRHPVIALGRGVVIGLLLAAITGLDGNMLVGDIIGSTGMIAIMSFSRDQERQSDLAAVQTIEKTYGHINGAHALFEILMQEGAEQTLMPEFLSTHPFGQDRIDAIKTLADEKHWQTNGTLTSLPGNLFNNRESEE